jgi:hypothetical protein
MSFCICLFVSQAQGLGVQELQCQAWGGSADALEASALALLELDPDFITVSICGCRLPAAAAAPTLAIVWRDCAAAVATATVITFAMMASSALPCLLALLCGMGHLVQCSLPCRMCAVAKPNAP